MTLASLAARIRAGELSPSDAVAASLTRIEAIDSELNAFISLRAEEATAEARELDGRAERGPLHGVPIGVKDVIDVAGARTTAGSRILATHVAERDAPSVERLRAAGAIVVGKLNTHEFAYGALTTSHHFGPARNPWSPDRVCGGSSGGSGAAAAAGLVAGTLGTDTAGSIRIPAAFCGVTGLRPSLGLVSTRGVFPVSWSFDTVGPIARTAEDCALLLDALAPGARARDALAGDVRGLRIGVVSALFEREGIDPAVAAAVDDAVGALRALGARVEPVEIPLLEQAGAIQQAVMLPEATAVHLPWLRTRLTEYGADVRARLLAGLLLPSTAYVTGLRARRLFLDGVRRVLDRVDLLSAPAMPVVPPRIGEETVTVAGRELPYRLSLIPFNSPWSLAGLSTAVVPCGLVDGLPVGLALIGRCGEDATVLRSAHAFQGATGWHDRRPDLEATRSTESKGGRSD